LERSSETDASLCCSIISRANQVFRRMAFLNTVC